MSDVALRASGVVMPARMYRHTTDAGLSDASEPNILPRYTTVRLMRARREANGSKPTGEETAWRGIVTTSWELLSTLM